MKSSQPTVPSVSSANNPPEVPLFVQNICFGHNGREFIWFDIEGRDPKELLGSLTCYNRGKCNPVKCKKSKCDPWKWHLEQWYSEDAAGALPDLFRLREDDDRIIELLRAQQRLPPGFPAITKQERAVINFWAHGVGALLHTLHSLMETNDTEKDGNSTKEEHTSPPIALMATEDTEKDGDSAKEEHTSLPIVLMAFGRSRDIVELLIKWLTDSVKKIKGQKLGCWEEMNLYLYWRIGFREQDDQDNGDTTKPIYFQINPSGAFFSGHSRDEAFYYNISQGLRKEITQRQTMIEVLD